MDYATDARIDRLAESRGGNRSDLIEALVAEELDRVLADGRE